MNTRASEYARDGNAKQHCRVRADPHVELSEEQLDSDVIAPTADHENSLEKAGASSRKLMVYPGPPEGPRREAVATLVVSLTYSIMLNQHNSA